MKILKRFLWLIVLLCMVAPGNAWDTFPLRAGGIHPSLGPGGDILVATYTEAAKLSMDGTYDFLWPTSDISAYAGVEGTRATHMAHVWDSAGKRAIAYLGAAGAGETLSGVEKFTNGDMTSDEPPGTAWTRGTDWTITGGVAVSTGLSAENNLYQSIYPTRYSLVKLTADITRTSGSCKLNLIGVKYGDTITTSATHSFYVTHPYNYVAPYGILASYLTFAGTADNLSAQIVTDCAVTGLHCFSDITCNTRGWVSTDAAFDYNAASYTIQIFKLR